MEKQAWKDLLVNSDKVDLKQLKPFNRQIRRAMSELRKSGVIFLPIGNYQYKRIDSEMDVEAYLRRETKHLATQYFNTVKPLTDYIKDDHKRELFGDLFKIMEQLG